MPDAPPPSKQETAGHYRQRADDTIDIQAAMKPRPQGAAVQDVKGKRFGKFTILKEIGRGGMGIVYQALDPDLRRQVALKVLLAGQNANDMNIKRFLREARAMSHLNHPHIVPVHEAGQIGKTYFFTMDIIQGRELGEVTPKMSVRDRLKICYQVCKALEFAHSESIIHRDLKPANIMVDVHHNPFVMDFGLAKDLDSQSLQSLSGTVLGTPSYMSPEQAQGHVRQLDHRSDIFSLGCILYEMIVGRMAFSGNTVFDTLFAVVNKEPDSIRVAIPNINPDLATIVERCLEKKPERRYPDMKSLAEDLLRYLRSEAVAAKRVSVGTRGWRWLQQHTVVKVGLLAGVPALAVLLIMLWAFSGSPILTAVTRDIDSRDPARVVAGLTVLRGRVQDGAFAVGKERETVLRLVDAQLGGSNRKAEDLAMGILLALKEPGSPTRIVQRCFHPVEDPGRAREILQMIRGFITVGVAPQASLPDLLVPHLVERARDPDLRLSLLKLLQPPLIARDRFLHVMQGILPNAAEDSRLRVTGIDAIGEHFGFQQDAMVLLARLMADDDPAVAMAAKRALGTIRPPEGGLGSAGRGSSAHQALQGIAKIQGSIAEQNRLIEELDHPSSTTQPKVTPAIEVARRLNDASAEVRLLACYDLIHHGDRTSQKFLVQRLEDPDNDVRRGAAETIRQLAVKFPPEYARIIGYLDHPEPLVRANAARLLGDLEYRPAAALLAARLAGETHLLTARSIITALGRIGDPASLSALADCLATRGTEHGPTIIATWKAHDAFGGKAYPHLVTATASAVPSVRQTALATLTELTGETHADHAGWQAWLTKRAR